ncbi:MAG: hypothetical protein LQ340_006232, partial [Diploschistes diacapsis]
RYLLAEILKKSILSTANLISIIKDSGIEPAWTEIALPNGRSVSSCQHAYNALVARTQQQPLGPVPPQDPALKRLKRPYSMGDAASTLSLTRELQPRPPTLSTVNGQPQGPPGPVTMSPIEPPRKKRGRPTKSEFERRQAEARERGEVWPRPRNKKTQRASAEGPEAGASAAAAPSSAPGEENVAEGATGITAAGSGEESSATSAAPTAMMYPPGTPASAPPSSPAGQRRGQLYEGMMPPAGQAQHGEPRSMKVEGGPEARLASAQPQQNMLADLRSYGPTTRGPPLQQRPSPGQFPPYGSPIQHQFQAYQMDDRQPGPRQPQK